MPSRHQDTPAVNRRGDDTHHRQGRRKGGLRDLAPRDRRRHHGREGRASNGRSEVDEYISKVDPKLRPQFKKLRSTIKTALPDAVESVKWGIPYYTLNGVGLASLADYGAHVNLYIMQGAKLSSDLLEGTGKGMRHITVKTVADIKEKEFAPLLREAGALTIKGSPSKRRANERAR
jgi:hypothetical protein